MRVLALDYGAARCGAAVSDPSGTLARPLPALAPPTAEDVVELAAGLDAEQIVVGLPVGLDGREGAQAAETRAFVEEMRERTSLPVDTYDERFTTSLASRSARSGARGAEDSIAAAHLLESWLAAREARA